jgi:hypothetical protein
VNKLGIIPVAGSAIRFGGVFKELLPIGNSETLLSGAVNTLEMIPVDEIIVVTNSQKIAAHSIALEGRKVQFVTQKYKKDIFGAIMTALEVDADWYYFVMPDTMQEQGAFPVNPTRDFMLGLFETFEPENFGVLKDGVLINKSADLSGKQTAWGTLVWSRRVANLWRENIDNIQDYTAAFNMAMEQCNWGTYPLAWYFDCGTFQRYTKAITHD